jgi:UDP-N-acetylglucosamine 2-epimerase (non-hydrolysing)
MPATGYSGLNKKRNETRLSRVSFHIMRNGEMGKIKINATVRKILIVFGTRPEAIKMAPVVIALRDNPAFAVKTVVTAQHREMLDQVLTLFGIVPDYDLNIMSPGQTLTEVTARVMSGLEPILGRESPDLLMVHGDTTTTFAGALAAFYHRIKVAHVEAGLRTGDKAQPFPEEMNRLLTGRLADLHFAPTAQAKQNLLLENIVPESIYITGNTVIDALHHCLGRIKHRLDPEPGFKTILVTAHRRENWGEPMERIVYALKRILESNPEVRMIIPVHRNPAVREIFQRFLGNNPRVRLEEPFDYQTMVSAMSKSYLVLTDSGGIQEEAPALGKPVLVLRYKTERPEAVEFGTVKLVGTEVTAIVNITNQLLTDPAEYEKMAKAVNPYGDGEAVARIVRALRYYYGFEPDKPQDFKPLLTT